MIARWTTKLISRGLALLRMSRRAMSCRAMSRRARASHARETRVGLDPVLAQVLACPQDKGPLYYVPEEDLLYNPRLARTYAIERGIPVLLIDEATPTDAASSAALDERIAAGELQPTFGS